MKRDMDLARLVLKTVEEKPDNNTWVRIPIPGFPDNDVSYHIDLLTQAGYLVAKNYPDLANPDNWEVKGLTWQGHEFLDAIKNDPVWNKVKASVKEKGGAIPFEVLKALALQVAKSVFGVG